MINRLTVPQVLVAFLTLVAVVGLVPPAFKPPETSHGPVCEWWEDGNRRHMIEQFGMALGALTVGSILFWLLRRKPRIDKETP